LRKIWSNNRKRTTHIEMKITWAYEGIYNKFSINHRAYSELHM
jgi:hypothetical protein